jgi:hypothetical protein
MRHIGSLLVLTVMIVFMGSASARAATPVGGLQNLTPPQAVKPAQYRHCYLRCLRYYRDNPSERCLAYERVCGED